MIVLAHELNSWYSGVTGSRVPGFSKGDNNLFVDSLILGARPPETPLPPGALRGPKGDDTLIQYSFVVLRPNFIVFVSLESAK